MPILQMRRLQTRCVILFRVQILQGLNPKHSLGGWPPYRAAPAFAQFMHWAHPLVFQRSCAWWQLGSMVEAPVIRILASDCSHSSSKQHTDGLRLFIVKFYELLMSTCCKLFLTFRWCLFFVCLFCWRQNSYIKGRQNTLGWHTWSIKT